MKTLYLLTAAVLLAATSCTKVQTTTSNSQDDLIQLRQVLEDHQDQLKALGTTVDDCMDYVTANDRTLTTGGDCAADIGGGGSPISTGNPSFGYAPDGKVNHNDMLPWFVLHSQYVVGAAQLEDGSNSITPQQAQINYDVALEYVDYDNNGMVEFADLLHILGQWGTNCLSVGLE